VTAAERMSATCVRCDAAPLSTQIALSVAHSSMRRLRADADTIERMAAQYEQEARGMDDSYAALSGGLRSLLRTLVDAIRARTSGVES